MTSLIDSLLEEIAHDTAMSPERRELLRDLLTRVVAVADLDAETKDLRVAVTAIDELLGAFVLFDKWRDRPKLTVFGSARTQPDNPLYKLAMEFSHAMTERGWITITGAGPGIMEASAKGAGKEHTLGVNIELPFEQMANDFINVDTNLVTMKYFFTRKVALTRPSMAFVVLPGGFGTMDELFEVITLMHTGKTTPAPIVLLDEPGGTFWKKWITFVEDAVVADDYIGSADTCLVRLTTSITESIEEIERFYSNYQSFTIEGDRAAISLRHTPTPEQITSLASVVAKFGEERGYLLENDHTISFSFDGRNYVNLRLVIDEVNSWVN
ncbi:MAG TPA: TIGR00730 family Rossman fold protein [Acidimicrobiales bacterium]